jgi:hypothetical protein
VLKLLMPMLILWTGAAGAEYQVPRTSFGDPDLQGIWTNATITTLERPDGVENLVLTDKQAAVLEDRRKAFYESYEASGQGEGTPEAGADPGGYNTVWMDEGELLARVDGEIRSSIVVEPADGRIPYRLLARLEMLRYFGRFLSYDGPEVRPLGERCMVGFGSTGGPPMLPVLYNNNYQIVQSPGHLMILVEMNHDARIVRLGGEHPPSQVRKWLGDSIGHWDGDTLVVETTNFHPDQSFRAALKHILLSSPNLTVTERFTRVAHDQIRYEFTMDDPTVYARPWRGELPLRASAGPVYEYACHEGNYALEGILRGARLDEASGNKPPLWQRLLVSLGGG